MSYFLEQLKSNQVTMSSLINLEENMNEIARACCAALSSGNKLLFCGNGGSAADAQHIAAEFTGRFVNERDPLAALALTTDTSALTCIGNDYGFNQVFSRQINALSKPGDVLFLITTSGRSQNILEAAKTAKSCGVQTVAFTGEKGREFSSECDYSIVIESEVTARIQEAHIFALHALCGLVERGLNYA